MNAMALAASTLDIVSVAISACIPVAIFAAGALLAKQARDYEANQWIRRKQYDTRLERWQEVAPPLNDLLCFFMLFGHFRDVTPPKAIKLKRQLDRAVYGNQYIFGERFLDAYRTFMSVCFQTYVDVAQDAKIRASVAEQRAERGSAWDEQWSSMFVRESDTASHSEIEVAYNDLLRTYDQL